MLLLNICPIFSELELNLSCLPIPSNQYAHHDCSLCETDTSMNILSTTALPGSNKFSTPVSVNSSHKGAVSFSKNPDRRKEQIMTWMPTEETRTQYVFLQVHRMDSGEGMAWTGCSKRQRFSSLKATERQPEFPASCVYHRVFNKASREPTKCVSFVLVKTGESEYLFDPETVAPGFTHTRNSRCWWFSDWQTKRVQKYIFQT